MTDDRHRREQARVHIRVASLLAWLTSTLTLLQWWLLTVGTATWGVATIALPRVTVISALAWWLWTRESPVAAWLLGVITAGSLAYVVVYTGSLIEAALGIVTCVVHYRGWRGAEYLRDHRLSTS